MQEVEEDRSSYIVPMGDSIIGFNKVLYFTFYWGFVEHMAYFVEKILTFIAVGF